METAITSRVARGDERTTLAEGRMVRPVDFRSNGRRDYRGLGPDCGNDRLGCGRNAQQSGLDRVSCRRCGASRSHDSTSIEGHAGNFCRPEGCRKHSHHAYARKDAVNMDHALMIVQLLNAATPGIAQLIMLIRYTNGIISVVTLLDQADPQFDANIKQAQTWLAAHPKP